MSPSLSSRYEKLQVKYIQHTDTPNIVQVVRDISQNYISSADVENDDKGSESLTI